MLAAAKCIFPKINANDNVLNLKLRFRPRKSYATSYSVNAMLFDENHIWAELLTSSCILSRESADTAMAVVPGVVLPCAASAQKLNCRQDSLSSLTA